MSPSVTAADPEGQKFGSLTDEGGAKQVKKAPKKEPKKKV